MVPEGNLNQQETNKQAKGFHRVLSEFKVLGQMPNFKGGEVNMKTQSLLLSKKPISMGGDVKGMRRELRQTQS